MANPDGHDARPDAIDANLFADLTNLDVHPNTLRTWYQLMHLGRLLDEKAARYLKLSKVCSCIGDING